MEIIFGEIFVHASEVFATVAISGVAIYSYKMNMFPARFAWSVLIYTIIYIAAFLAYRYGLGHAHTEAHTSNAGHRIWSSIHGTISLLAIIQAGIMFTYGQKAYKEGRNFFKQYTKWTIVLIILWSTSLLSGFIL